MKLVMQLDRIELGKLPFAVIVENWNKAVGREASGSKRRAYHAEFDEKERKVLSWWYNQKFYRWYLVTGIPKFQLFRKIETIELIKRAGNFFACV